MYTVQPSRTRRSLSFFATSSVCSFSVMRPRCVSFTAPESGPPWPASRTTFPEQEGTCAPTPVVKAAVVRTIAARIAANTVAHALRRPWYVISYPFPLDSSAAEEAGPEAAILHGLQLGFEADPLFGEGRLFLTKVHLFLEEAFALGL